MSLARLAARLTLPALLLSAAGAPAAPNIEEGLWEFEMKLAVPGAPPISLARYTQCLTRDHMLPTQRDPELEKKCEAPKQSVKGNTVSWTLRCKEGGSVMEISGKATYSGNRMNGVFKSTVRHKGQKEETSTSEVSGKRIGPCR
mgnify:CR=1 FL=1